MQRRLQSRQRPGGLPHQRQLMTIVGAAFSVLLASAFCGNPSPAAASLDITSIGGADANEAENCESLSVQTVAPVLLQTTAKRGKVSTPDDADSTETTSDAISAAAGRLADGLVAGVGLINPLLQTTEEDYVDQRHRAEHREADVAHPQPTHETPPSDHAEEHTKKPGGQLAKVFGSDLMGDALEPTHQGGDSKEHLKEHSHGHGYACLLFLFGGLTLGSLILMINERFMSWIPYTAMLFVAGFVVSGIHNSAAAHEWFHWNSWDTSVTMWEEIDPHMLFYIFLPALVFSEAMRLNKHLVKSCIWQILLLAGPGVLIGTALLGTFSHYVLPYGWSWPICLVIGAILSATDPVAVVALFNTLGVSPRLTMVISGESLLNDGTAFVVFTLMLKVALGATMTPSGVALFFGNMTIVSFVLGWFIATFALWVISCCALERGHSDALVQVVITISCSYLCFFLAESELSTSGILSLVSSGFTLAYTAWPRFVSKEIMHTVWEAIEFVGNTMIFLLAGLLFADAVFSRADHIESSDFGWLAIMYLGTMAVRAILLIILWMPLRAAGCPLTWQEGLVLTWSGLRGAVSLAMAIIVDTEPAISKKMGTRVMFHVGGIAALTLLINAPTTARLLSFLGLTREPEERERLLEHLQRHMAERTNAAFGELVQANQSRIGEIQPMGTRHLDDTSDLRFAGGGLPGADPDIVRSMVPVLQDAGEAKQSGPAGASSLQKAARLRSYREIFLQVVQNHYWESIEQGIIPRNNKVSNILLGSKDEALADADSSLNDWAHILPQVNVNAPTPHSVRAALANFAQSSMMSWIPGMSQAYPTAEVIQTWKVYAVLSLHEAHKCARAQVPGYFNELEDMDREVQELVAEESRQCCKDAEKLLDSVDPSAVSFGRSRMLAQKLLRLQLAEVASLQSQGVLNSSEAHHMDGNIHDALLRIARAENLKQMKVSR